jgi:SAM-dependent methyltransferase
MADLHAAFLATIPAGGRLLDGGCGAGRDVKIFAALGYDVDAFDASAELARIAAVHTGRAIAHARFQDLDIEAVYDGIWCAASLLHVMPDDEADALQRIARALKPGGIWYLCYKVGHGRFEDHDRSFRDHDEASLAAAIAPLEGCVIERLWRNGPSDPAGRRTFVNALVRKSLIL